MDSSHDESNSSFLSDVLDFVSRELNQFVANATGAPVAAEPDTQSRRETQSKRPSELQRVKSIPSHSSTSDSSHVHSKRYQSAAAAKLLAPNSPPRPKYPMTMPGALLPRSPTSEPDQVPGLEEGVCQLADVGQGVGEYGGPEAAQPSSKAVDRTQRDEVDVQPSTNVSSTGICTSFGACKQTQKPSVDNPKTIAQRNERGYATWVPPENNSCHDREPVDGRVGRGITRLDEERMQDKERIRILEEEVERLREQLSLKRDNMSSFIPPPPPPPPPLPPSWIKSNRDRVPLDPSDASSLIASARASLKRAPAPVEASINPPLSTKRQGLPTVGIPPDKMAAFLNEMKSVRLRKIAGVSNRSVSAVDSSADSSTSWSNTSLSSGNSSILSRNLNSKPPLSSSSAHSHASNISIVGEKRKREWFDDERRRAMPDMPEPIAVVNRPRTNAALWIGTDPKNSSENSNGASSRSWLSLSTADTTTPSLTSDNDQDISPDDLPTTPPQTHTKFSRGILESLEVIDVDDFVKQTSTSGDALVTEALPARPSSKSDLFSKRTPLSPLPSDTPRKPQPPSRLRRSPCQRNVIDKDFPSRSDGSHVHRSSQGSHLNQPQGQDQTLLRRSGIHHRRQDRDWWSSTLVAEQEPSSHKTLDEELRRAVNSLKSVGEDISFDTEECDVFLGTGTRDKSLFSSLPAAERDAENRRTHTNHRLPAR